MMPGAALPVLDALAWTLIHFLWQGCVVGLLYAAVRVLLPRTRNHLRYAAGLGAMAALVLVPAATFILLVGQGKAAPLRVAEAEAGFTAGAALAQGLAIGSPAGDLAEWTVALWLAGVLLVALRSWLQWLELRRASHRHAWPDDVLQASLDALLARFGHPGPVRVLVSRAIDTPTLIGWLRPVVLVPAAVALRFPAAQLELILAHELGHLCRRDHLVNLLQALVETLFFYHPVVHWIARDVRAEREICCDLLVLERMRGEPRVYARVLADLEELRQPPPQLALAANGGALLERVRRIVGVVPGQEHAGALPRRLLLALAVLSGVAVVGAWTRMQRAEPRYVDAPAAWHEPVRLAPLRPADLLPSGIAALAPIAVAALESGPEPVAAAATASETAAALPPAPAIPALPDQGGVDATRAVRAPAPQRLAAAPAMLASAESRPAPDPVEPPAVPAETAPAPGRPIATRVVEPEYPARAHSAVAERVELGFAVAGDGTVDAIEVLSAPRNAAYARAAERALGKWRFDPTSGVPGATYRQTFVFTMPGQASDETQGNCQRVTGSRLCRRVETEDVGSATATVAQLPGDAAGAGS
jgi:TonB family protein